MRYSRGYPRTGAIPTPTMQPEILESVHDDIALGFITGAMPSASTVIDWAFSSSPTMEEARAYAARLKTKWKSFMDMDVERLGTKDAVSGFLSDVLPDTTENAPKSMGQVLYPPGVSDAMKAKIDEQISLKDECINHYNQFVFYADKSMSGGILGDDAKAVWAAVKAHEDILHADRDKVEEYIDLKSDDPGDVEKNKPPLKIWPYVAGVAAVGVLTGVGYVAYQRYKRNSMGGSNGMGMSAAQRNSVSARMGYR